MKTFAPRWLAAAAILLATCAPAVAQEALKIGYVNSERVLRESTPAKAAKAKLDAEFGKRERELNETADRLKMAGEKLEKDSPTLSQSELNNRRREQAEKERDLQRRIREFQEDRNLRSNEEMVALVERANRVIKQIFDSEKYDLILQEAIFASPRIEITDKVIKLLNAPTPAPAAGK